MYMKYNIELLNKISNLPEDNFAIQYLRKGNGYIKIEKRDIFTKNIPEHTDKDKFSNIPTFLKTKNAKWMSLDQYYDISILKFKYGGGIRKFNNGGDTSSFSDKVKDFFEASPKQQWQAIQGYLMAQARAHQYTGSYKTAMNSLDKDTFTLDYHLKQAKKGQYYDIGQDTYLFSRKEQEEAYLNNGYILDDTKNYGLVKNAVGNRDLPVYIKNKDVINRDSLTVVANPDIWLGNCEDDFVHAGSSPSALYVDSSGNFYQQSWNLQDYGIQSAGNNGASYSGLRQHAANMLDKIGNPVVMRTGIRPVNIENAILELSGSNNAGDIITKIYSFIPEEEKNKIIQNILETEYAWMIKDPDFQDSVPQSDYEKIKQDLINKGEFYNEADVYRSFLSFDNFKNNLNKYFSKKLLSNLGIPAEYYNKYKDFSTREVPYSPHMSPYNASRKNKSFK